MNMMNGAPYYSPPSRHIKTYGFGTNAKPLLSELPGLIEKAIKAGLVTRPVPQKLAPPPTKKWKADWHYATCNVCKMDFIRGYKHLEQCVPCRRPLKKCNGCGKDFRPIKRKTLCCSQECVAECKRTKTK
jgi:hypothetical protein